VELKCADNATMMQKFFNIQDIDLLIKGLMLAKNAFNAIGVTLSAILTIYAVLGYIGS
jgi:hypothetical protein